MKIIIFRCDRIGDFVLSSILINNLKINDKSNHITVVCSSKNYNYVKNSNIVDKAIVIPSNFFRRLKFYLNINKSKYDKTIVLDGKKKSIISSILIKCNDKILLTNKKNYKKYLNIFFSRIFYSPININKIDELKLILSHLKIKLDISLSKYKNTNIYPNQEILNIVNEYNNFNLYHFDEKWINDHYIKTYENIQPNIGNLQDFLEKFILKSKCHLILSTGLKENDLILKLRSKYKKINENIYQYKIKNFSIFLIDKINIFNLEYLISKSKIVVTCHGASSHLANMYNKTLIDIIDRSEDQLFRNWTNHFTNHTLLYRSNFQSIAKDILNLI